ncbi:alpha/beta fold hydrolase [Tessaracoccus sp. MC1756]|uniref:alpha/beta fold hydrolase n=1 Tax=Tessaracoccus sp. MC1756 TaxID=2760311 RepID=UPI0015FF1443|nr:alpha/beta fold hydrolase [Tessaracoccus sp. MC1756]MBB1509489.1 alpha/beta fold hydrolase [Tessaracoccus sp. MC1756]
MNELTPQRIQTNRLTHNVWTAGPEDGTPLLLVHGNLSSGGFWRYVVEHLGADVRVIAPDLRGFGDTDPLPIDARHGLGDMVDDLHDLLSYLGLAGQRRVNAVGWSMGAGVLQQLMLEYRDDLASVTLIAPLSPYGYGGTKGTDGQPATADHAGAGAGGANPAFVARLAAHDTSEGDPQTSPRVIMRTYFGGGANHANLDEDFLTQELVKIRTGDDFYPGNAVTSENWPGSATGDRGVLNTMSPRWYNTAGIVDLERKPPVLWIHASEDKVVANGSLFDLATLGQLGAIPGWPGEDVLPPQPMVDQTRAVLERYRANGGEVREVFLEGEDHGIPLAVPGLVAEEVTRILVQ